MSHTVLAAPGALDLLGVSAPDAVVVDPVDRAAVRGAVAGATTSRIVVAGDDSLLAAVLSTLLVTSRLGVEVGYAAAAKTHATRVYGLPHGAPGFELAVAGAARPTPLVRDDAAVALVGRAVIGPPEGRSFPGETYVDSQLLVTGDVRGVVVEPLADAPGVCARRTWGLRRPVLSGRAVQTGGTSFTLVRDGIPGARPVKRSSFYRHADDWLLVRP